MADGAVGLQIQWIIAVAVAEFFRNDAVIILVLSVEDALVQVVLHDMLIVKNAVVTMGAVSKSVMKPTRDVPVRAFQDINSVGLHAMVCKY